MVLEEKIKILTDGQTKDKWTDPGVIGILLTDPLAFSSGELITQHDHHLRMSSRLSFHSCKDNCDRPCSIIAIIGVNFLHSWYFLILLFLPNLNFTKTKTLETLSDG